MKGTPNQETTHYNTGLIIAEDSAQSAVLTSLQPRLRLHELKRN